MKVNIEGGFNIGDKDNVRPQNLNFKEINPNTYEGGIPIGFELVIAEKNNIVKSALSLYGFDEIGLFDHQYTNPVYGFLKS